MREKIKQDLPNFPDEVIDQWLLPFAETDDWPPIAERWKYLLTNTDLDFWKNLEWYKEKVAFETIGLSPQAESQIAGLIQANILGEENDYSREIGNNSLERIQFHSKCLCEKGAFIVPPVLVNHGNGFDIMDGSHRITAYWLLMEYVKEKPKSKFEVGKQIAWLAVSNT